MSNRPPDRARSRWAACLGLVVLAACGEDAPTEPPGPEPPAAPPDAVAPLVTLSGPGNGAEIAGTVVLTAKAADDRSVTGVQFLVDGEPYGPEDTVSPYSVFFRSSDVADGAHAVSARARDAAGNATVAAPVAVTVLNDPGAVELTVDGPDGLTDADGFRLYVDDSPMSDLAGAGTFTVAGLPAGTRRLTLGGLPPFCTADEQTVTIRSTVPAAARLTIVCEPHTPGGWLLISRYTENSFELSARSIGSGRRTVLVPDLDGSGAVSPDGTRLAFIDGGMLLIGDLDAFAPVPVVAVPGGSGLSWSPDGSALVVAADRGGVTDLYVVDADGTGLRPLFPAPALRRNPAWSPTGRIAFEVTRPVDDSDWTEIWSADSEGENVTLLQNGWWDEHPAWSPDGSRLAFISWVGEGHGQASYAVLMVDDAEGTGAEELAWDEAFGSPAWSPDGNWIVYGAPGALRATHVSGTPSRYLTGFAARPLAWVEGDRFD